MVGVGRFELPTSCSQSRRANRTALHPGTVSGSIAQAAAGFPWGTAATAHFVPADHVRNIQIVNQENEQEPGLFQLKSIACAAHSGPNLAQEFRSSL
jgi:hypothetical protein